MKILFLISSLFWSMSSIAQAQIETIQLNHRLATELLAEVQAFLPAGVPARAFNNFIIIKAESDVISDIKQLVHQLDTPLQRLKISVLRTDHRLAQTDDNSELSSSYSVKRLSTKESKNKEQYYQAQGIADKPVLIMMEYDIPQKEQYIALLADGGVAIQSTTRYINIANGFQAVARILPNHHVSVDILPVFGQFSKKNGLIEQTEIISTLSGPVGNWLELGQINNSKNTEKRGSTRYHSHRQLQQFIYIKIDAVN